MNKIITMYDPPSGWKYGFPKEYKFNPKKTLEETLVEDGYPTKDAEFAAKHTRFWETVRSN